MPVSVVALHSLTISLCFVDFRMCLKNLFIVLHVSRESMCCTNMLHGSTSANKLALHRHSKTVVSKLERNNAKGHERKSTVGGIAVAAVGGNILK